MFDTDREMLEVERYDYRYFQTKHSKRSIHQDNTLVDLGKSETIWKKNNPKWKTKTKKSRVIVGVKLALPVLTLSEMGPDRQNQQQ